MDKKEISKCNEPTISSVLEAIDEDIMTIMNNVDYIIENICGETVYKEVMKDSSNYPKGVIGNLLLTHDRLQNIAHDLISMRERL